MARSHPDPSARADELLKKMTLAGPPVLSAPPLAMSFLTPGDVLCSD
jgi:hypothetical protein